MCVSVCVPSLFYDHSSATWTLGVTFFTGRFWPSKLLKYMGLVEVGGRDDRGTFVWIVYGSFFQSHIQCSFAGELMVIFMDDDV